MKNNITNFNITSFKKGDTVSVVTVQKGKQFLDYIVPENGVVLGSIVKVPIRNKLVVGVVWSEGLSDQNLFVKKKDRNIFITENKRSYLFLLANKMKSEIVHHNNFIGGRYSVLSEVGMLPAELMGLSANNFRNYNNLIKNKYFLNNLVSNVCSTLYLVKKKKFNSIIIN